MGRASTKWLQIVGRLKTGTSYEQARAELQMLFQAAVVDPEVALLKEARPDHPVETWHLVVEPAHAGLSAVRRQYGAPLLVLLAISGLVLGIACVNVANLLLTRASARSHEIAIRLSLGAARARVVRQLLTESMLLATAGAAVGIALAYAGCRYLLAFFTTSRTPIALEVGPDLRMLAFTGALAVATGLLFGLAPAWRATVRAPGTSPMAGGRVRGSRDRQVLSRMLIAGQVALSVMMLFSAGLFLRSLHNLHSIDTGFDSSSVLLISTDPSRSRLTADAQRAAYREALARLAALPGAQAASLSHTTPIEGGGTMRTLWLEGDAGEARREAGSIYLNWVSPDYFATMSTPIYSGRDFTWQDTPASPKVAIINQRMARQYFGNESPLGKRVTKDDVTYEIVAMAGDAKYLEIRDVVPPSMYFSAFQVPSVAGQLAIRTAGRPGDMAAAARDVLRAVAPSIALTSVRSLQEQIDASIVGERMLGALSGVFAALGLLLVSVGLYGVMSYSVSRRTSEIGIRMALGAQPSRISRMVVREALMLTAAGVVAGIAGALLLSRSLASLLYGLTPTDPLTMWACDRASCRSPDSRPRISRAGGPRGSTRRWRSATSDSLFALFRHDLRLAGPAEDHPLELLVAQRQLQAELAFVGRVLGENRHLAAFDRAARDRVLVGLAAADRAGHRRVLLIQDQQHGILRRAAIVSLRRHRAVPLALDVRRRSGHRGEHQGHHQHHAVLLSLSAGCPRRLARAQRGA